MSEQITTQVWLCQYDCQHITQRTKHRYVTEHRNCPSELRRIKPLINLLKDENIIDQHPKMVVKKVSTWLYNEVRHG